MSVHHSYQKNIQTFRNTFTKGSRIYRFLYEEWKLHPLYLQRTLSYVNKHRDRRIKPRSKKIEDVVKKLKTSSTNARNGFCKSTLKDRELVKKREPTPSKWPLCCYYNWICDDPERTNQRTRSHAFMCPWCEINHRHLDTLMMHLKCCHPRFQFNLVEEDGVSVIEMTKNSTYDGSYCGFKWPGHDQKRDFRFAQQNPLRRTCQTQIIYIRPKRRVSSHLLAGFSPLENCFATLEDGEEVDVDVCSGRLYYHTSTCLPVKPNEGDIDSEADMDPDWLRERTQLMIDEFTDVNEGEKELLKLWNLHIMSHYKYKSDSMIPDACRLFVDLQGSTIWSKNLTKNFVLHLANLYDYGLLSSRDVLDCNRRLRNLRPPPQNSPIRAATKVKLERNSNEHCQLSPPAKRALLNSHYNQ